MPINKRYGVAERLSRRNEPADYSRPDSGVEYNPEWPHLSPFLRDRIWPSVRDIAVAIEHVASIAVPGLAATPIIYLDVVIPSRKRRAHNGDAARAAGLRISRQSQNRRSRGVLDTGESTGSLPLCLPTGRHCASQSYCTPRSPSRSSFGCCDIFQSEEAACGTIRSPDRSLRSGQDGVILSILAQHDSVPIAWVRFVRPIRGNE